MLTFESNICSAISYNAMVEIECYSCKVAVLNLQCSIFIVITVLPIFALALVYATLYLQFLYLQCFICNAIFAIQWKPLNRKTFRQRQTDSKHQLIVISEQTYTCIRYKRVNGDLLSISIKDFVREKKIRNRKKERAARAIF
jgi:hypothetical protein